MDAPASHDQNADQIAYWNGPAGQRWTDREYVYGPDDVDEFIAQIDAQKPAAWPMNGSFGNASRACRKRGSAGWVGAETESGPPSGFLGGCLAVLLNQAARCFEQFLAVVATLVHVFHPLHFDQTGLAAELLRFVVEPHRRRADAARTGGRGSRDPSPPRRRRHAPPRAATALRPRRRAVR